jgi:hypothetical protein
MESVFKYGTIQKKFTFFVSQAYRVPSPDGSWQPMNRDELLVGDSSGTDPKMTCKRQETK